MSLGAEVLSVEPKKISCGHVLSKLKFHVKKFPIGHFIGVERWALSRPICANQKLLTMPNNRLKIRKNKCPVLILSGNPIDEKYHDIQKYLILTLPTVVVAPIVGFIFDFISAR